MRITKLILICTSAILLAYCTNPAEMAGWRGPDRNGIYLEENLLEKWPENGPELLWEYKDLGLGYSSASVLSDKVITAGTLDSITYLFAFSHEGEVLWKSKLGKEWMISFPGINGTPVLYGDEGYILNGLGKMYCFNIENGEILWEKDLFSDFDGVNNRYGVTENFLIEDDIIYVTPGGTKHNVVALNRISGDLVWSCPGMGQRSAYCSPMTFNHNGVDYLATLTDSAVMVIDKNLGKLAWTYNLGANYGTQAHMPVYKEGHLFIGTYRENNGAYMFKIADNGLSAEIKWETPYLNRNRGEAILLGDNLYGTHNRKKKIYKLDWNTGNVLDSLQLESASTLISDGKFLYSYDHKGNVQLIKDGDQGLESVSSFKFEMGDTGNRRVFHCAYQVIKDGRLYIRCDNILRVYSIAKS